MNQPPERSQGDGQQDLYSDLAGTDTGTDTLVRQEFKDECDINNILNKFGVDTPTRQMTYGAEIDYTMDLQQAIAAVDAAKRANFQVPEELKAKYPDWRTVLNGAESGQYQADLAQLAEKKHLEKMTEDERAEYNSERARQLRAEKAKRDIQIERGDLVPRRNPED